MSPDAPPPAERPSRRRLRPVTLLAISLLALDLAVRHFAPVWERHSPDDYAARIDGCRARPRDFIVVGGSPVSEGFDPEAMAGLTWQGRPLSDGYAVGLPGATTTDIYHALRHAAPVAPKLVIYGLSPTDLNDARNEPHGAYSIDTAADVADIWRTRPDVRSWTVKRYAEGWARSLWGVYRYRHGIRMAAALACNGRSPDSCPGAADRKSVV